MNQGNETKTQVRAAVQGSAVTAKEVTALGKVKIRTGIKAGCDSYCNQSTTDLIKAAQGGSAAAQRCLISLGGE